MNAIIEPRPFAVYRTAEYVPARTWNEQTVDGRTLVMRLLVLVNGSWTIGSYSHQLLQWRAEGCNQAFPMNELTHWMLLPCVDISPETEFVDGLNLNDDERTHFADMSLRRCPSCDHLTELHVYNGGGDDLCLVCQEPCR